MQAAKAKLSRLSATTTSSAAAEALRTSATGAPDRCRLAPIVEDEHAAAAKLLGGVGSLDGLGRAGAGQGPVVGDGGGGEFGEFGRSAGRG